MALHKLAKGRRHKAQQREIRYERIIQIIRGGTKDVSHRGWYFIQRTCVHG